MEKFKRNPLAASVMTGVTALLGGIEPAVAAETHAFGVSVSDTPTDNVTVSTSNLSFFDNTNTTAPTSFFKFDDQGGALTLTQVVVNVITTAAALNADVSGNCGVDVSGNTTLSCSGSAQNASEFSALIALGSGISLGADQDFSTAIATKGCEFAPLFPPSLFGCEYSAGTSSTPSVSTFSATITGADLALFIGSGSFNVTPGLGLGGPFSATVPFDELTEPFNDYAFSATTNWQGTIDVTYTFEENGVGVPEPATLLLFGTGLAGLGLLRRKPKSSA